MQQLIFLIVLFVFAGINGSGIKDAYCINLQEYKKYERVKINEDRTHTDPDFGEVVHISNGDFEGENKSESEREREAEHGADMSPLFFVIIALIIGAATRHFLQKSPLPYTVTLLIFGLILGVCARLGLFHGWGEAIESSVKWAGHIDPHLILFVFLPTLIFEAAFAMDVHTFKKTSANAIILAVPGIIVAILLTALFSLFLKSTGLGLLEWSIGTALMFGAIISATDPVAVVALLKELGASKKLNTLIEGESLLNDGTAIVIFMVFYLSLQGQGGDTSPIVEFLRVSLGGVLVGLIVGAFVMGWVKKVFNDAMVEISIIVAAAYLTFFLAEHFFHVSGVLGLVAYGLTMAGVGRTRISPEVEHFLHEFWELMAFIANTLIFIIVGVVIAQRTIFTPGDFIILFLMYIAIHIIRAIVIAVFFPIMRKAGYGLSVKESCVLWYGGLRGAVGLALALVVASAPFINENIRHELLFLTAGIVTLTLLVNATTIKRLINKLGLTKFEPAKALMIFNAQQYLKDMSERVIELKIKPDKFLRKANFDIVREYLPDEPMIRKEDIGEIDTLYETRRRILEKEKSSYWHLFKEGLIGPTAVQKLLADINEIIDAGGKIPLSERQDLETSWKIPKLLAALQSMPVIGRLVHRFFYDQLSVSYDTARGFIEAQKEALKTFKDIVKDGKINKQDLACIEEEINENRIHGLTFLRNLKKNYPEIYNSISTRQAIRTLLNNEKKIVERLIEKGRLNPEEAHKIIIDIETKMKELVNTPPKIDIPDKYEFLRNIPIFRDLKEDIFEKLAENFQIRFFSENDRVIKESETGDSIFVIVRGTVCVTISNKKIASLSTGTIIGEMAILTGKPSTATVTAESPVTTLRIKYLKIKRLFEEAPELESKFWKVAATRFAQNILSDITPFNTWKAKKFRTWLEQGEIIDIRQKENINFKDQIAILLKGKLKNIERQQIIIPISVLENLRYNIIDDSKLYVNQKSE